MKHQQGFTLIELIVVIVILGILAATALPKFANLASDARAASLNGAKGSLASTASMAHGLYLAKSTPPGSATYEGATVTFTGGFGYPIADTPAVVTAANGLMAAAGITNTDYTILGSGTAATANSPLISATQTAAIPKSVAGTVAGLTCYVMYTAATSANAPPTVTVDSSGC